MNKFLSLETEASKMRIRRAILSEFKQGRMTFKKMPASASNNSGDEWSRPERMSDFDDKALTYNDLWNAIVFKCEVYSSFSFFF